MVPSSKKKIKSEYTFKRCINVQIYIFAKFIFLRSQEMLRACQFEFSNNEKRNRFELFSHFSSNCFDTTGMYSYAQ